MISGARMNIKVKFFAIVRDRANCSGIDLAVPDDSRVENAIELIGQKLPEIKEFLSRAAYAVNQSYVQRTTRLHEGDELAVIPPVSGG